MNNGLNYIGLARRSGRVEIGEEATAAATRGHKAFVVCTASDASPHSVRRAELFAEAASLPHLPLPATKTELGAALGRESCAMLALCDAGLALALARALLPTNPAFAPAVEILTRSAARMQKKSKRK